MKRNLSRMFRTGVAAAAALLCAMPFQAAAEDYPSRPITLIMPFGAGNAPDTAARIIGDYLQRKHNITLLITSKPGGSGIPATLETVRARPDGYTISLTSANVLTVVPQYKKCGFTYKDLAPVAQVNVFTMGWGVRADSGIASVQDLMDKAKAERGKYSLASPGAFTAQRFYHANVMKLFPESDLPYVAYNGGAEIVTALLGNHISAGFTPVVNFKPHKDIRVIAGNMVQTVALRAAALGVHLTVTPEAVARLAEAGYDPDYGARPLRRTVQTQLEDPLAEALLTGELSSGGEAEAVVDETGHVAVRAKGALTAS